MNLKKSELEKLREPILRGSLIRSRARWVEHGEKPSRYFCNLEKRNYTSKVINRVETEDKVVTEPKEILIEQANYYKKLYSSTKPPPESDELKYFLQDKHINKMDEDQKLSCEGKITELEAQAVIKTMANNKTPGSDGFPVDFYKVFWKDLGHFLLRSLNHAYESNSLSITQKQGVITCLPKGSKPRQFLKNWRPITLLNVDYKILSACLAKRMKNVLNEIISPSQKGFLPDRFIGENTRLIFDIANYLEQKNLSGILLLLDFEKAFDSVEWSYLERCLDAYNFGPDFKKWFKILYAGSESCTTNNGHMSPFFRLERGCRQGDPLSPYLFLLAIEPLAAAVKQDGEIRGIKIGEIDYVIGQYADDTFLLLENDENSLRIVIDKLKKFQLCSGLKINVNKSYAAYLGIDKGSDVILCPDLKLQWTTEFTLLGIQYNIMDLDSSVELNTIKKLEEIRLVFQAYKRRNLSVLGKITVVKTLALPKLVHALSVLPNPSTEFYKKLNEMICIFVWNNKYGKVSRNLLAQARECGGLKLTHIASFTEALKIRWIKCVLNPENVLTPLFQAFAGQEISRLIWALDKNSVKKLAPEIKSNFWADAILAWARLLDIEVEPEEIPKCTMWNATYIKNINLQALKSRLIKKGCIYISDLLTEDCSFLNLHQFRQKFHVRINWFDYHSLIASIPREWKQKLETVQAKPERGAGLNIVNKVKDTIKTTQFVYSIFIKQLTVSDKYKDKWKAVLGDIPENEWKDYNTAAFRCTLSAKLQSFQYKILHNIVCTNKMLKQFGISPDDRCTFCNTEVETSYHLFVQCREVNNLWNNLADWLAPYVDLRLYILEEKHVILGMPNRILENWLLLQTKYYIYRCRVRNENLCLEALKKYLRCEYQTELSIAKKCDRNMQKFGEKWEVVKELFV